ncbi:MAG: hypothetical protein ACLFTE_10930 [Salinivenus sp.]
MRFQFLWVLVVFGLVAGCAGSSGAIMSYDSEDDEMRYEAGPMTVAQRGGGGYGSQTSIQMRVRATCEGRDCVPDEARMTFSAEGESDVAISSRKVSVTADDQTFEWGREVNWRRQEDMQSITGHIVSITLPLSDLDEIATASAVDGRLGDLTLDMGRVQSELQAFVQTAQNPSDARQAEG